MLLELSHYRTLFFLAPEEDGQRQQSPESPIKPLLQEPPATTPVAEERTEEADGDSSKVLPLPAVPSRKNSDASRPNPR